MSSPFDPLGLTQVLTRVTQEVLDPVLSLPSWLLGCPSHRSIALTKEVSRSGAVAAGRAARPLGEGT